MLKCCGELTAAGNYCSSIKGNSVILIGTSWSPAPSSPLLAQPHPSTEGRLVGKARYVSRNPAFSYTYCNLAGFSDTGWLPRVVCVWARVLAAYWPNFPCGTGWEMLAQVSTAEVVEAVRRGCALGLVLYVTWKLLRSGRCGGGFLFPLPL